MRVGLALPHYDFSYPDRDRADAWATVEWAVRAESLGFDSVWISDHFFLDLSRYGGPQGRQGSIEALTTLGGIAVATSRVRLGTLVLCEAFRPWATLSLQARSLQQLSGGRLELGIGAGWFKDEFDEHGFDFGSTSLRMVRLEGALMRLRQDGPAAPVWVGGKGGPRILAIAAAHADGWNTVWKWTPDAYADRAQALDQECERAGRDPKTMRRSIGLYTVLGKDPEQVWERVKNGSPPGVAGALDDFKDGALVGSAEACAERLAAFARLGVEEVIISPGPLPFAIPYPEMVDEIAETLIPLVRDV